MCTVLAHVHVHVHVCDCEMADVCTALQLVLSRGAPNVCDRNVSSLGVAVLCFDCKR